MDVRASDVAAAVTGASVTTAMWLDWLKDGLAIAVALVTLAALVPLAIERWRAFLRRRGGH